MRWRSETHVHTCGRIKRASRRDGAAGGRPAPSDWGAEPQMRQWAAPSGLQHWCRGGGGGGGRRGGCLCKQHTNLKDNHFAPHNNTHTHTHAGSKSLKKSEVRITALAVPDCRAHYRRCTQSHYTAVQSQSLQNTAVWPRIAALARGAARYIEP